MENGNKSFIVFGLILGLSLIISTALGAFAFYKIRTANYVSTTGSAKKSVVSDKVRWASSITQKVKVSTVKNGYAKMDTDLKEVKNFLAQNGITEDSITVSPIFMNEIWNNGNQSDKDYNLVQNIEVQSDEVKKIDALAKNTMELIKKGVLFTTNSLEFYYSKLPEVRVELLDSAVADAKARANKLAEAGGKKIGVLKSASSGVVQVMAPNSVEVSDYGMYDTSKINKEVMVTVKASFEIK
jgi:hypothetical protein